jgi:hypothetical protein
MALTRWQATTWLGQGRLAHPSLNPGPPCLTLAHQSATRQTPFQNGNEPLHMTSHLVTPCPKPCSRNDIERRQTTICQQTVTHRPMADGPRMQQVRAFWVWHGPCNKSEPPPGDTGGEKAAPDRETRISPAREDRPLSESRRGRNLSGRDRPAPARDQERERQPAAHQRPRPAGPAWAEDHESRDDRRLAPESRQAQRSSTTDVASPAPRRSATGASPMGYRQPAVPESGRTGTGGDKSADVTATVRSKHGG